MRGQALCIVALTLESHSKTEQNDSKRHLPSLCRIYQAVLWLFIYFSASLSKILKTYQIKTNLLSKVMNKTWKGLSNAYLINKYPWIYEQLLLLYKNMKYYFHFNIDFNFQGSFIFTEIVSRECRQVSMSSPHKPSLILEISSTSMAHLVQSINIQWEVFITHRPHFPTENTYGVILAISIENYTL